MKFQQWLKGYEKESANELKKWQNKSNEKCLIPSGFDEKLIQQYNTYRIEMETKRLVIATWVLAMASILLSVLTIFR